CKYERGVIFYEHMQNIHLIVIGSFDHFEDFPDRTNRDCISAGYFPVGQTNSLLRDAGFEPVLLRLNITHLREPTHKNFGTARSLLKIIKTWAALPETLKAGVLAIVRSFQRGGK